MSVEHIIYQFRDYMRTGGPAWLTGIQAVEYREFLPYSHFHPAKRANKRTAHHNFYKKSWLGTNQTRLSQAGSLHACKLRLKLIPANRASRVNCRGSCNQPLSWAHIPFANLAGHPSKTCSKRSRVRSNLFPP